MDLKYITAIATLSIVGIFQPTLADTGTTTKMDFATAKATTEAQANQTHTGEIQTSAQSRAVGLVTQNLINQPQVASTGLSKTSTQRPATSKDMAALFQTSPFKPYSAALRKCLLESTTSEQKENFARWMFIVFSSNPTVRQMISVSSQEREQINKSIANTYTTLMTQTCRNQTNDVMRYEGTAALETAFSALGAAVMQELISNPSVRQNAKEFTKYIDRSKFENQSDPGVVASK